MCIIVYKPAEADLPSKETLEICFSNHDDGCGYVKIGKECIVKKGFMTFDDFWESYEAEKFTEQDEIAIHFRTGTSAENEPEYTHPFPITDDDDDLKLLHYTAKQVILHNGIISAGTKELSDTMIFIKKVLYYLSFLFDDSHVIQAIENITDGSKLLIIDDGDAILTGDWDHDVDSGLIYSNTSYLYEYYGYYYGNRNLDKAYNVVKKNGVTTYLPNDSWNEKQSYNEYITDKYKGAGFLSKRDENKVVSTYTYYWCSNCRQHYHEDDIEKIQGVSISYGVDCPTCYHKLNLEEVDYC